METVAGEGQVGDAEAWATNPAAATVIGSMSEGSNSPNDSFGCTDTDNRNLSKRCSAESHRSSITVGDTMTCNQAADTVDITDAGVIESLHCHNESTADDSVEDSKSVESIIDISSKLENRSELSQVNEIQSDHAETNEDDGWMYVLGHDQLKKRACIM